MKEEKKMMKEFIDATGIALKIVVTCLSVLSPEPVASAIPMSYLVTCGKFLESLPILGKKDISI